MKLSNLLHSLVSLTLALAVAIETREDEPQPPTPFSTIRVELQCRGQDCTVPPATPILEQFKDGASFKQTSADHASDFVGMDDSSSTRWIGEIHFDTSSSGPIDFRVDGDHLFKYDKIQVYHVACTATLGPNPEPGLYHLDFQNKMDDSDPNDKSFANFGDKGPRVKCWSSPLPHVENDEKFKRQYSLQIVERCADPSTCFDGDKTLPVVSHMEGNLMVGTDAKDLDAKIIKPNTDYVQLARFDFDAPTFNYASQLPEPIIFWVGGHSDIGNDDRTCEVRVPKDPGYDFDTIQVGEIYGLPDNDQPTYINLGQGPGGGLIYCYKTPPPPDSV